MQAKNDILNECLKYFIQKNTKVYQLSDIQLSVNYQADKIIQILNKTVGLFEIIPNLSNPLIKISISLKACKDYNSYDTRCKNQNCIFFHVCEYKFSKRGCEKKICKLDHSFYRPGNLNKLDRLNIDCDPNILMEFFQLYYNSNESIENFNLFSSNISNKNLSDSKIKLKVKVNKNFVENGNKNLLENIFSDMNKIGGGQIEMLEYFPNKFTAYIKFKNDSISRNLIEKKEIRYLNFKFIISETRETKNLLEKNNLIDLEEKSNLNDQIKIEKKFIYLKNLNAKKPVSQVKRYAYYLTDIVPVSANVIDEINGVWLLNFDTVIDFEKIEEKFQKIKKNLPPDLKIDINYDQDIIKEKVDKSKSFEFKKRLKDNIFLQLALNDRNNLWKKDLIERFDKINSSFKVVNDDLVTFPNDKNNLNEKSWKSEINNLLSSFFKEFIVKTINYQLHDNELIQNLINKIENFRPIYHIDYMNDKLNLKFYLMVKRENFNDFLNQNQSFNSLFRMTSNKSRENSLEPRNQQKKEQQITSQTCKTNPIEEKRRRNRYINLNKKRDNLITIFDSFDIKLIEPLKSNQNFNNLLLNNLNECVRTEIIQFPLITYHSNSSIIYPALNKLKSTYNLQDYYFNTEQGTLSLTGLDSKLTKSIDIFNKCLKNIVTKRIEGFNINILKSSNLQLIIDDCLKLLTCIFKVNINANDLNKQLGIFVTYFSNIPELDSDQDIVYDQVSKYLLSNLDHLEIDITKNSHLLLTENWKKFRQENFENDIFSNNFTFRLEQNSEGKNLIMLSGKKDFLMIAKFKIENFFSSIKPISKTLDLIEDNVMFFKKILRNEIQFIEKKYDIKIEFKENKDQNNLIKYELRLDGIISNNQNYIEHDLKNLLKSKRVKIFSIDYSAGIKKVFEKYEKHIAHEISAIESETNCAINYETHSKKFSFSDYCKDIDINKKQTVLDKNHTIQAQNTKSSNGWISTLMKLLFNKEIYSNQNDIQSKNIPINLSKNKLIKSIKIADSTINLEFGNIIDAQTDVIVNTTTSNLNLQSGILSAALLISAGDQILNECIQNYPKGINNNEIAITSAGNLKNSNYIFHSSLTRYTDQSVGSKNLISIINNCMQKLKEKKQSSISFPALGTGGFGYPADLVSKTFLETISQWLFLLDKKKALKVNIVVFETGNDIAKDFKREFDKFEALLIKNNPFKKNTQVLEYFANYEIEKTKIDFKIIHQDEKSYSDAEIKLKDIIFTKYLIKEQIRDDIMKYLTEKDFSSIANKFKDCELIYENQKLLLEGLREDVLNAKVEITTLINAIISKNYSEMEKQMRISKDVQWQYEDKKNYWKNFPVYLNSLIESNYQKKISTISFENEDSEECIVYFNINPMIYIHSKVKSNVRRLEISKLTDSITFPSHWTKTNNDDFELINVPSNSNEFLNIKTDFLNKFQNQQIRIHSIERIQNETLYRQYLLHKDKFKKENKNLNELNLFHGSSEDSLKKICKFGFNRSFCGKNGTAFGQGVYFALNSHYSNGYAHVSPNGIKGMIRALVLVGESCIGNSSMKTPPERPDGKGPYDSTTDQAKAIYVCYHDNQCYPEYLINYF